MDAEPCEWWHGGLSSRRHRETASLAREPTLRPSFASPLGDDDEGVWMSKSSACQDRKNQEKETGDDETVDSENVNELSDLFSTIESEYGDSAIDFSVLLEGEHAFNVEEVSEIFTDLEAAAPAVALAQDADDAVVVDEIAELFSSLESQHATDSDRDSMEAGDDHDAENVDELSELFSSLEEKEEQSQDWIAALEVEDISSLYSELERLEEQKQEDLKPAASPAVVDPRIFVPKFAVRMEGSVTAALPRVSTGAFLTGPPALLAGPPVRSVAPPSVLEKHKCVESASPTTARTPDPSVSETRRICAAKRRRVNGRFVREQNTFVSITSLQP